MENKGQKQGKFSKAEDNKENVYILLRRSREARNRGSEQLLSDGTSENPDRDPGKDVEVEYP